MSTVADDREEPAMPCPNCGHDLSRAFPMLAAFEQEMDRLKTAGKEHHRKRRQREKAPLAYSSEWTTKHFGAPIWELSKDQAKAAFELLLAEMMGPDLFNQVLSQLRDAGLARKET